MDNQKVRAHLRKGELAVMLLESLGYRYVGEHHPPRWEAPAKTELQEFKEQLTALIAKPTTRTCPVRSGARFSVLSLPSGHFLQAYVLRGKTFTVVSSEWIEEGSEKSAKLNGFIGWVVHFNFFDGFRQKGLWLPLSCIKVAPDADF